MAVEGPPEVSGIVAAWTKASCLPGSGNGTSLHCARLSPAPGVRGGLYSSADPVTLRGDKMFPAAGAFAVPLPKAVLVLGSGMLGGREVPLVYS